MKEKIEKKLEEFADFILAKENPTMEEVNFIVFMLNRIEMKEGQEQAKADKEKSDKEWKDRMAKMFSDTMGGV